MIVAPRTLRFGVIGCGMMGKEFASAASRWCHLNDMNVRPEIVAVCDTNPQTTAWFSQHLPGLRLVTNDYKEILADEAVDAVYCAVPHHLHAQIYVDTIEAGKHLLGEKPFGIDRPANEAILTACTRHPDVVVRCSSEFPFYPGAYRLTELIRQERFGQIIEVEAGFWHSTDLNPEKPINWKRRVTTNGEYGCLGDLGMHVVHIPFRFGWAPTAVRALLTNVMRQRPDAEGNPVPCDTWDNAILACDVENSAGAFPMVLSTKRIAPGHANTWFLRINGTALSAVYTTQDPKRIQVLPYEAGGPQAWHVSDIGYETAYPAITGGIFEFGLPDAILQMWAAFCDEVANGTGMQQSFHCATPKETAASHALFTAALESERTGQTVRLVGSEAHRCEGGAG